MHINNISINHLKTLVIFTFQNDLWLTSFITCFFLTSFQVGILDFVSSHVSLISFYFFNRRFEEACKGGSLITTKKGNRQSCPISRYHRCNCRHVNGRCSYFTSFFIIDVFKCFINFLTDYKKEQPF